MRVARVLPANYRYGINIAVGKGEALNLEKVVEPQRRRARRGGVYSPSRCQMVELGPAWNISGRGIEPITRSLKQG